MGEVECGDDPVMGPEGLGSGRRSTRWEAVLTAVACSFELLASLACAAGLVGVAAMLGWAAERSIGDDVWSGPR